MKTYLKPKQIYSIFQANSLTILKEGGREKELIQEIYKYHIWLYTLNYRDKTANKSWTLSRVVFLEWQMEKQFGTYTRWITGLQDWANKWMSWYCWVPGFSLWETEHTVWKRGRQERTLVRRDCNWNYWCKLKVKVTKQKKSVYAHVHVFINVCNTHTYTLHLFPSSGHLAKTPRNNAYIHLLPISWS